MPGKKDRLQKALDRFEEAHREDPRRALWQGEKLPWSVLYHRRMRYWVERLAPDAAEALLLAAACQHIRRWTIPRDDYPMNRSGYKRWRKTLARFHAQEAARILSGVGYDEDTIQRVQELLQKVKLKRDPEVQLFEDAICLVFLENELSDFAQKHDEQKLVSILQKTWKKMSPRGHAVALELANRLPAGAQQLVEKALVS